MNPKNTFHYFIFILTLLFFNLSAFGQILFPESGSNSVYTCSGTLLDPGGSGNYPTNTDGNLVIYPSLPGQYINLNLNLFQTESAFDNLFIYDGTTIGSNLISTYSGSLTSGFISSSDPSGALSLRFRSDANNVFSGFSFNIGCSNQYLKSTLYNYSYSYTSSSGFNLVINSNTNWTVSGIPSWLILKTSTGFGNAIVNMTATGNNSLDTRDAELTLAGINLSKKIYIFQDATPPLNTPNTLGFTTSAGSNTFLVNAYSYSWSLVSTLPSGFTLSPISGTGSTLVTLTSNINTGINNLSNELIFSYLNKTKKIQIVQLGAISDNKIMQSLNSTTITACSGNVISPGQLNRYINNENSTITIVPSEPGQNISLNIKLFDTESSGDRLQFFNGLTKNDLQIGNNYFGYIPEFNILSDNKSTGAITLHFTSDNSSASTGFLAEIGCINVIKMPLSGVQTITSCNSIVLDNGGVDDYQPNSNGWLVIVPSLEQKNIKIDIQSFKTESRFDFLTFYHGVVTTSGSNSIDKYSGFNTTIPSFVSNQGPVTLNFTSDNALNFEGFMLKVSCVNQPPVYPITSISILGENTLIAGTTSSTYSAFTDPITATSPIIDWYISNNSTIFYNTTSISITPNLAEIITITAIAYNRVSTVTSTKIVNIIHSTTGINPYNQKIDLTKATIYPNPSSNQISIFPQTNINSIQILNSQGQLIFNTTNPNIDINNFKNGIYIVKIQYKNQPFDFYKLFKTE